MANIVINILNDFVNNPFWRVSIYIKNKCDEYLTCDYDESEHDFINESIQSNISKLLENNNKSEQNFGNIMISLFKKYEEDIKDAITQNINISDCLSNISQHINNLLIDFKEHAKQLMPESMDIEDFTKWKYTDGELDYDIDYDLYDENFIHLGLQILPTDICNSCLCQMEDIHYLDNIVHIYINRDNFLDSLIDMITLIIPDVMTNQSLITFKYIAKHDDYHTITYT